jgi:hypothetical protein
VQAEKIIGKELKIGVPEELEVFGVRDSLVIWEK